MFDVIYANENLKECAALAKTFGFNELVVIFPSFEKINVPSLGVKITPALIVNASEFSKLQKYHNILLIAEGSRAAFESKRIKFVFPEMDAPKDHTHYRKGGMDQILANLAKKTGKTILFDFSLLLNAKNKQQVLGRMMQNAELCKKYKVPFALASFARTPLEMRSLKDFEAFQRTLT